VRLITNFVVIPWDDTGACCRGMAKDKKCAMDKLAIFDFASQYGEHSRWNWRRF